jgi:hypothetical protein
MIMTLRRITQGAFRSGSNNQGGSMKARIIFVVLFGLALFCSPVMAADLVGTWESIPEKGQGALSGSPDHQVRPAGDHFLPYEITWILEITDQQGNGIHGKWCSAKGCEALTGVIRRDGTMLMVDEDSTFFATMYGDEMELCVTEPGEGFRIAACNFLKKQ